MKRTITYCTFVLSGGEITSQVTEGADSMLYLRKRDIFNRKLRYNPREERLECCIDENDSRWDVWEASIYGVNFYHT